MESQAEEALITVNGLFRPFALVRGRAAGRWTLPAGKVLLEPFGTLGRRDAAALRADAQRVLLYLGKGES